MKIISAEFIRSCTTPEQFPQDRAPEIAFIGRSNVGKSSLLNSLLNRKALAKVSRTPGKTRLVNFFLVTTSDPDLKRFYAVDLPGYGYAQVAKSVRAQWGPMIEGYLKERLQLRGVLLLVESRGLERHDLTTLEWLRSIGHEPLVVATKLDKLRRTERRMSETVIKEAMSLPQDDPLVAYSSVTHEGRDVLWHRIRERLASKSG